jgi:hypothetical protein
MEAYMNRKIRFLCVVAAIASASAANASTIDLWHGWMNITPCSKVDYYEDDFGIQWPTVRTAPQELHGYVRADVVTTTDDVRNVLVQVFGNCAAQGAAAAGTTALITGGPGSWEAFQVTFKSCVSGTQWANYLIQFRLSTESKCNW